MKASAEDITDADPDQRLAMLNQRFPLSSDVVSVLKKQIELLPAFQLRTKLRSQLKSMARAQSLEQFLSHQYAIYLLQGPARADVIEKEDPLHKPLSIGYWAERWHDALSKQQSHYYPLTMLVLSLVVIAVLCHSLMPVGRVDVNQTVHMRTQHGRSLSYGRMVASLQDSPVQTVTVALTTIVLIYCLGFYMVRWVLPHHAKNHLYSGSNQHLIAMAQFCDKVAYLLGAGLTLSTSTSIAGRTSRYAAIELVGRELTKNLVMKNESKAQKLAWLYTPLTVVAALENPNVRKQVAMLRTIAEVYQKRQLRRVDWISPTISFFVLLIAGLFALEAAQLSFRMLLGYPE